MSKEERTIGIIAAMDVEIDLIKEKELIDHTDCVAEMNFCVGTIGTTKVVAVRCGMGKTNAAMGTQLLITKYGATEIINVGCAGCLNENLNIGDYVVSTEVVQHDFDCSPTGFLKGEIPYTGKVSFEADKQLIQTAVEAIARVAPQRLIIQGRICTGDQFISTESQKNAILSCFGGDCAEMEAGSVGQVAALNHIPFVIIRSMSDKCKATEGEDNFMDHFEEVTREGAAVVVNMIESL